MKTPGARENLYRLRVERGGGVGQFSTRVQPRFSSSFVVRGDGRSGARRESGVGRSSECGRKDMEGCEKKEEEEARPGAMHRVNP